MCARGLYSLLTILNRCHSEDISREFLRLEYNTLEIYKNIQKGFLRTILHNLLRFKYPCAAAFLHLVVYYYYWFSNSLIALIVPVGSMYKCRFGSLICYFIEKTTTYVINAVKSLKNTMNL